MADAPVPQQHRVVEGAAEVLFDAAVPAVLRPDGGDGLGVLVIELLEPAAGVAFELAQGQHGVGPQVPGQQQGQQHRSRPPGPGAPAPQRRRGQRAQQQGPRRRQLAGRSVLPGGQRVAGAPDRPQRRGPRQRPAGGRRPGQRQGGQQHQEQADEEAVPAGEPDRLLEAVPDKVQPPHPAAQRQQGQQRPGGEFFPPGAGAGEEEQDQRRRHRAAVEVGQGAGDVRPEKVAEKQPVGQLPERVVGRKGEVQRKKAALALLHLQQGGQQQAQRQPRPQRPRPGKKPQAAQQAAGAGPAQPEPEEIQHAEQADRPGGVEVEQRAGEDQQGQRPVAAGLGQGLHRPEQQRRQHHHVHPEDVLAVDDAEGAQAVPQAEEGQQPAGAARMPLQEKAAGRAGAGGAQRKHQLDHPGDGPHREQQVQKVEGAVHVIGEQPQRAAAAELGEAVEKAALAHPPPHVGDVVDVQAVQVAGEQGAVPEGGEAQQGVDRQHQQQRKAEGQGVVAPLPAAQGQDGHGGSFVRRDAEGRGPAVSGCCPARRQRPGRCGRGGPRWPP